MVTICLVFLGEPRSLIIRICINDLENNNGLFWCEKIVEIEYLWSSRNSFLQKIEECFNKQKTNFCYKIHSKPFFISIEQVATTIFNQLQLNQIINSLDNEEEENEEDSEYSEDEEIKQINTEQTFKSVECVICISNPPNVFVL